MAGSYGKDSPERFISGALEGGTGPSNQIINKNVNRPNQSIKTALAMDNMDIGTEINGSRLESSIRDGGFRGSTSNITHSLDGATANKDGDIGAAGPVKSTIIPNH